MTGYCMSVRPYFHEPQASENTAQECNIQPYYFLTHQIKVVAACIFNKLLAAGLFLALDGTSTHIDPSTSGIKYRKLAKDAIFMRNESPVRCFSGSYECIPIKAHAAVATQHMP